MKITDQALQKIKSFITKSSILYIGIEAGGCSGMSYKMEWKDEMLEPKKILHTEPDLVIITDMKSSLFLENVTLDYEDGLNGKGFSFNNEKAKRVCGCGESFSV